MLDDIGKLGELSRNVDTIERAPRVSRVPSNITAAQTERPKFHLEFN
jgi:hypothetical protein